MKKYILLIIVLSTCFGLTAQREMEKLNRGLIALNKSSSVYLSWRLFALEDYDIGFNIYRSTDGSTYTKLNSEEITETTDYLDETADVTIDNYYYVIPVIDGVETTKSEICTFAANTAAQQHYDIALEAIDGLEYTDYHVLHVYPGDIDGDGDYDFIVKRFPVDASYNTILLDCYDNEGNFLWRIDLGPNVETYISSMTAPVLVADFDSDGKAEIIAKTGEETVFGDGTEIGDTDGDGVTDYNSHDGSGSYANVMDGPEFLSYIDGETGAELDRDDFLSRRDPYSDWGDTYGARMNFMMSAVGYFDGVHPACVFSRGDGEDMDIDAWQIVDGELTQLWYYTARGKTYDVGGWTDFHQVQCIDVDGDGKDETSWGACMMDDDGTVLYTTKYCHGDRFQITDINPDRDGLEVFICQQYNSDIIGSALYDAATGTTIKDWYVDSETTVDIGRCDAADVDPNSPGLELFDVGQADLHAADGTELVEGSRPYPWVSIWWDGDLLRENLIGVGSGGYNPAINKWNVSKSSEDRLFSIYSDGGSYNVTCPYGGRMPLVGDIIGDWREEIFLETSDRTTLRIYSSYTLAEARLYTLMQNPAYRTAITTKGYLCTKYTDYFLGADMDTPPTPDITYPTGEYEAYYPEEGYYNIISVASDLSLSTTDDFTQQTSADLEVTQIWYLEKSGDYYKIYSPEQDAYLSYDTPEDGGDLNFTGSNNEFYFEIDLSGNVLIISALDNSYVIDVPSCLTTVGLEMNFWSRLDNDCQSFTLVPAETLYDCAGVWEGTAYYDDCGTCVEGTTGNEACTSALQGEDFCSAVGVLESKNLNYVGEGYVNFDNELSSSGSWNIYAGSAGTYTVGIRYANGGTAARGMSISVNDTVQATFTAETTGDWEVWEIEYISLTLTEGVNTIEAVATTDAGGPNIDLFAFTDDALQAGSCETDCNGVYGGIAYLDNCDICVGGNTGLEACEQIIAEAEDVTCSYDGTIDNNDSGIGFSGTGFINGTNALDASVTFNIYADAATSVTFGVQYAHGGTQDRTCRILVNGVEDVASFSMPITDWTDYQSVETDLNLEAGINEITLVALTSDGLANLDYYYIYGDAEFTGCDTTQSIDLIVGWNLVSTYVVADDMSIAALFPNATEVKTLDDYYNTSQDDYLNTISSIDAGVGYLLYNTVAETITIIGVKTGYTLSLQNGLNLIGCPYTESTSFENAFGTESDSIQLIQSFDGEWSPDGTQTIDSFEPGKAYFIMK